MGTDLFSLKKPSGANVGGGGGIHNELILVKKEDIVGPLPPRAADGVTIAGSIQLQEGKKMHSVYVTNKTLEPTHKHVAGSNADCFGYEVGVSGFHPGLGKEILSFLALHGDFTGLVLLKNIKEDGSQMCYLLGTYTSPVELGDADSKWGKVANEDKGTTLTFKGTQAAPYAIYEGALQVEEAVVAPADATSVAYKENALAQLSSGTAASATLAEITGMKHGDVIAIAGSGGAYPTLIKSDGVFMLKGGRDWTAAGGALITLKAFNNVDADLVFIEQ
jgi:hypothetical protein